jgi:hypothetical protein
MFIMFIIIIIIIIIILKLSFVLLSISFTTQGARDGTRR